MKSARAAVALICIDRAMFGVISGQSAVLASLSKPRLRFRAQNWALRDQPDVLRLRHQVEVDSPDLGFGGRNLGIARTQVADGRRQATRRARCLGRLPTIVLDAPGAELLWAVAWPSARSDADTGGIRRAARLDPARRLPFGPFLCLAGWLVWLYGPLVLG